MISTAYQYFLSEYGRMEASRYDAHKKSELRQNYNNVVSLNKTSPLYSIDLSEDTKFELINLAENSRILRNKLYEVFGNNETAGGLQRKSPYSSNPDILDVEYIGVDADDADMPEYLVRVKQLATPQVNVGDFLHSDSHSLSAGTYSFDLSIGNNAYEFQFKVNEDTTNYELQDKLSKLINRSDIGLDARVIKDANGSSAIEITSLYTGSDESGRLFYFSDDNTSQKSGSVEHLGLNNIKQLSDDAIIEIDGTEISSATNSFTYNNMFQIDAKATTTGDEFVEIGFHRLPETINSELQVFADTYNKLFSLSDNKESRITQKLGQELNYISAEYSGMLETIGMSRDENGYIQVDSSAVLQSAKDGTLDNNYSELLSLQRRLLNKTTQISSNPFVYIDNTVVTYPNPASPSYKPYQQSAYTGLLFSYAL
ncbi:MAG: hypothetical protein IJW18_04645 [Lachnospiraceae bacterium]|nr:hypothetical protein [Lachnospiraceae bacterium]